MRARAVALALVLSLAALAAPTVAAAPEPELADGSFAAPCIFTGLVCLVIDIAQVVLNALIDCVQDLHCIETSVHA